MKKEGINSHTCIAKSILKRFADKNEKNQYMIQYIDFSTMKIEEMAIIKFNVVQGYYSKTNEKILADNSESLIGMFISKYESSNINNIDKHDIDFLYKYLAYQLLRQDYFMKMLMKDDRSLLTIRDFKNMSIKEEEKYLIIYNALRELNMNIQIIQNNTNTNFVLPFNSMYSFEFNDNNYFWILVLSPKLSVSFSKEKINNESYDNNLDEPEQLIIRFDNEYEDLIKRMNVRALGSEYLGYKKTKQGTIIGKKEELEFLLELGKAK